MKDLIVNISSGKQKVRRSNHFINAEDRKTLTPLAQKVLLYFFTVVDRSKPEDMVTFDIKDLYGIKKLNRSHYVNVDKACRLLSESSLKFTTGEPGKHFKGKYIPIFSEVNIDGCMVSFEFNQKFSKLLTPSDNYTDYMFQNINEMRSTFSMRVYELLKQGVGRYKTREFTVVELKKLLAIDGKPTYNRFAMLKNRVLDVACREITEKSDLNATWEISKKVKRTVVAVKFHMELKDQTLELDTVRQDITSNVSFESQAEIEEEPKTTQASINFGGSNLNATIVPPQNDFDDKVEKLKLRLEEIGVSKATIAAAVKKYRTFPTWKIWPEVNAVRMAVKDGNKFPNKHTLRKFILGEE
ncbi:replication initiation protein [Flammeovirga agarivorans]|uniref:Replication initiation protein n=1 Tax=Flammeovirga agarivorans TaxID=2726742 RepID=A0A7X8SNQ3_9BACT|nr:replication initiation protein [Flammeovirga agarivorans]NLR93522.1 replication initiation protein [Flammeovirga agarivorans]